MADEGQDLEQPQQGFVTKAEINELFEEYINSRKSKLSDSESLSKFISKLHVNTESGLDDSDEKDFERRRQLFGQIKKKEKIPFVKRWLELLFNERVFILLLVLSACSLIIGIYDEGWADGWINGIVLLACILGYAAAHIYMTQKQEKKMDKLDEGQMIEVKRNSSIERVKNTKLLVGDIIRLSPGQQIPADGVLIEAQEGNLNLDESTITGESQPIECKVGGCLLESTKVVSGEGFMVVLRIGSETFISQVAFLISPKKSSQFPEMIENLFFGAVCSLGVIYLCLSAYQMYYNADNERCIFCVQFLVSEIRHLQGCAGILLLVLPEAIELAFSFSLLLTVKRMLKGCVLIRRLSSIEKMGRVTDVCTDTHNILTEGCLSVQKILMNSNIYNTQSLQRNESVTLNLIYKIAYSNLSPQTISQIGMFMGSGSSSQVEQCIVSHLTKVEKLQQPVKVIDSCLATFISLLVFSEYNSIQIIKQFGQQRNKGSISQLEDGKFYLFVQGATEHFIDQCSNIYFNDVSEKLDEEKKKRITELIEGEQKYFREIGFGMKLLDDQSADYSSFSEEQCKELEKGLTYVGSKFASDKLRSSIPNKVKMLQIQNITTRIVTGDSLARATYLAIECGIVSASESESSCIEGNTLLGFSEEELDARVNSIKVLARATPQARLAYVESLRRNENRVAVVGDSTVSVVLFQKASVSFALGMSGTDIARESADALLLSDSFGDVAGGLINGRHLQAVRSGFYTFWVTSTILLLSLGVLSMLFLNEIPLSISWIILLFVFVQVLAGFMLAKTSPSQNCEVIAAPQAMDKEILIERNQKIALGLLIYSILALGFMVIASDEVFGEAEYFARNIFGSLSRHGTMIFHVLILLLFVSLLNQRSTFRTNLNPFSEIRRDKVFAIILASIVLFEFVVIQFSRNLLNFAPLSVSEHLLCYLLAAIGLGICVGIKKLFLHNFLSSANGVSLKKSYSNSDISSRGSVEILPNSESQPLKESTEDHKEYNSIGGDKTN